MLAYSLIVGRTQQQSNRASLLTAVTASLESSFGPEHPEVAAAIIDLAKTYYGESKFDDAERLLRRALGMCEKTLGPEHPRVAVALNDLAAVQQAKHRYKEAESLYGRALSIQQKSLKSDDPAIARTLDNLAATYCAQRRYQEAEPLYRLSLNMAERRWGLTHPDLAVLLADYARLLRKLHQKDEARRLDARVRALQAGMNPTNLAVDWRDLQKPLKNTPSLPR